MFQSREVSVGGGYVAPGVGAICTGVLIMLDKASYGEGERGL